MATINLLKDLEKNPISGERMLGKGSMMPFNASNSGSRKIMFGTQLEQRLGLVKPDVAFVQTGYEKEFGLYSSSFYVADMNYKIIANIPKYLNMPRLHYYLICLNEAGTELVVFERKEYKHITENYGYIYANDTIDECAMGDYIKKGTVLQKSMAFDDYQNRMDGKNLLTMYTACEETILDGIVISESAAKSLSAPLIKVVDVIINDNDIPLNLYGDESVYKIFPDIGEYTNNSILCGIRREKKEEALYTQSYSRLRELFISDDKRTVSGKVVDIDIYCNAPDKLIDSPYNGQLAAYYNQNMEMCRQIVENINPYIQGDNAAMMSYDLQRLYHDSLGVINGKQYYSERAFSNIVLRITLVEDIPVLRGDKLSNRYGGKGITATIRPDYLMPKMKDGRFIDVLMNMCGVYGRENCGQLEEMSVTYFAMKLIEYWQMEVVDISECVAMYLQFIEIVAPSMFPYMESLFDNFSDEDSVNYMDSMVGDDCFYIACEPMSENMTIDKLDKLYKAFPWIQPENVLMPIIGSNKQIRYVDSRRPLVYGYQYIYRLKQYAEEKFSVTSLSSTDIQNQNTRNKSSNNYKALFPRTPIRFGDMETGDMLHLGADLVIQILMIYSSSPMARRLTESMLTGDPFNIDVRLDLDSTNRNAEKLNVYLKTIGYRIIFKKIPKKLIQPVAIHPVAFYRNPNRLEWPVVRWSENEIIPADWMEKQLAKAKDDSLVWPVDIYPVVFDHMPPEV